MCFIFQIRNKIKANVCVSKCQLFCRLHLLKMSFLSITDPKRRDALVREYANTVKTIQEHNATKRLRNTISEKQLAKHFNPVVKANEAVSSTITKELAPLQRELVSLSDTVKENTRVKKQRHSERDTEDSADYEAVNVLAAYYLASKREGKDSVYGIFENAKGRLQMGDKAVQIENDDIVVGDTKYKGTEGLWTLVMDTRPKKILYTSEDLDNYKEMLRQTDVIFNPNTAGARSRPRTTTKWKRTIEPLIEKDTDFFSLPEGDGICHRKQVTYLPGDVQGLKSKMKLLLAEFLAGNTATRNELVYVLDELKRRGKISNSDYTKTNSLLASK